MTTDCNTHKLAICSGCKKEIDLDLCWCGSLLSEHTGWEGHYFVPFGCDCTKLKVRKMVDHNELDDENAAWPPKYDEYGLRKDPRSSIWEQVKTKVKSVIESCGGISNFPEWKAEYLRIVYRKIKSEDLIWLEQVIYFDKGTFNSFVYLVIVDMTCGYYDLFRGTPKETLEESKLEMEKAMKVLVSS